VRSWATTSYVATRLRLGGGAPVHCCNDADGLGELVHVVGSAPRRKHVLGQVVDILVPHPIVGIEECLQMPPRALYRVCMSERRRT